MNPFKTVQGLREEIDKIHSETNKLVLQLSEIKHQFEKIAPEAILKKVVEEYAKLGGLRSEVEQLTRQATYAITLVGQQSIDKQHTHPEFKALEQALENWDKRREKKD
jgi:uncharacterized protein YoxC